MQRSYRRFEVLVPLQFNDGQPVPDDLISDTLVELENHFGAVSSETQPTHGRWQHEGRTYRDKLLRVYVDIPETDVPKTRRFFVRYKERLKRRFRQIDIWMTTYRVDVI